MLTKKILLLKIAIVIMAYFYLFKQLYSDWNKILNFFQTFKQLFSYWSLLLIVLICLFAFINWAIEALKWNLLLNTYTQNSFKLAVKQILIGLASGVFTPNRLGEIPARAMILPLKKRKKAIFLAGFNSIIQMLITLIVGLIALFFYAKELPFSRFTLYKLLFLMFFVSIIPFLFQKVRNYLKSQFKKLKISFKGLSKRIIIKFVILSFLRYSVYLFQYYWAYHFVGIEFGFIFLGQITALLLLFLHILPIFNAVDIGIRGSIAILLFKGYGVAALPVFVGGFIIWGVNIFFPALIGGYLLLRKTIYNI